MIKDIKKIEIELNKYGCDRWKILKKFKKEIRQETVQAIFDGIDEDFGCGECPYCDGTNIKDFSECIELTKIKKKVGYNYE